MNTHVAPRNPSYQGRPVVFNFARESSRAMDCGLNKKSIPNRYQFCQAFIHLKPLYSRFKIRLFGFLAILSEKLLEIHCIVELCYSANLRPTSDNLSALALHLLCTCSALALHLLCTCSALALRFDLLKKQFPVHPNCTTKMT